MFSIDLSMKLILSNILVAGQNFEFNLSIGLNIILMCTVYRSSSASDSFLI